MYTTPVPHGEKEGAYIPGPIGERPCSLMQWDPRVGHVSSGIIASYRQAVCQGARARRYEWGLARQGGKSANELPSARLTGDDRSQEMGEGSPHTNYWT